MAVEKEQIDTTTWVDDYSDMLYNYAVVRVSDHELALDLVQDTFVSALKGLDSFKGNSTVKTWLFSILKRKIIDHWRKKDSRKTRPMSSFFKDSGIKKGDFLEASRPQGMVSQVEKEIENKELGEVLDECISGLPDKWRGIIVDKMVDGRESDEVCKDYEITASNLWVIVHRAKLQLRECLEKKWMQS